jgi:hypothetical protein
VTNALLAIAPVGELSVSMRVTIWKMGNWCGKLEFSVWCFHWLFAWESLEEFLPRSRKEREEMRRKLRVASYSFTRNTRLGTRNFIAFPFFALFAAWR